MVEKTAVVQVLGDHAGAIEVIAGSASGQSALLSAGTFVIGSDEDCDLALPREEGVSRIHAKIVAEGSRYRLVDNGSPTGTLLNGAPAKSELLENGDVIDIAHCRILFRQMEAPRAAPRPSLRPEPVVAAASIPAATPGEAASSAPQRPRWPFVLAAAGAVAAVAGIVPYVLMSGPSAAPGENPGSAHAPAEGAPAAPGSTVPTPGADRASSASSASAPPAAVPVAPAPGAGEPFLQATAAPDVFALLAPEAGRVQAVPGALATRVKKGDVVLVITVDGGSAAAIATRRESIAALESIAADNEAAAKQLASEKAALKALLAQAGTPRKIAAPADGTLAAVDVKVGDMVRPGEVMGRIDGAPVARVRVDAAVAQALERGAPCELRRLDGTTAAGLLEQKADLGGGVVELTVTGFPWTGAVELRCRPPSSP